MSDYSQSPSLPTKYQGVFLDNLSKSSTPIFNSSVPFDNRYLKHQQTASLDEPQLYHTIDQNVTAASTFATVGSSDMLLTDFESAILRSHEPIHIDETEEIEVAGNRGIWANKSEVLNWPGHSSLNSYVINEDPNPEIVTKKTSQTIEYVQEMAIRYLKPPTPEPPGDIIITQHANEPTIPAPPVIIRQQPPRPRTPEPLVYREAPPTPPPAIGRKVITIAGKKLPPPPRKVIIERLAPLPEKPRAVLVERWLPYTTTKRRVIFNKVPANDPVVVKPRNVIVQWEAPQVNIRREVRYLGVVRANPAEYAQRYGTQLKRPEDMPSFINEIKTPEGIDLAANHLRSSTSHELYGDIEALRLIDLDREGLSEYRNQLNGSHDTSISSTTTATTITSPTVINQKDSSFNSSQNEISASIYPPLPTSFSSPYYHYHRGANNRTTLSTQEGLHHHARAAQRPGVSATRSPSIHRQIQHAKKANKSAASTQTKMETDDQVIDRMINLKTGSRLSVEDAEKTILRVNSQLGRRLGQEDVKLFFATLNVKTDGTIDSSEFKSALINIHRQQI